MATCSYCGAVEEDNVACPNCGSIMIKEAEWESEEDELQELCPRCKEGILIRRYSDEKRASLYGCSNYPYCEYTCDIRSKKSFNEKTFEKKDEFIQWLQKREFKSNTIETYITAVSLYTAFLQGDKIKIRQETEIIPRKKLRTTIKHKREPYPNLTIEQIVKLKLRPLLTLEQVDATEIQKLTDSQYCKQEFGLDFPLLLKERDWRLEYFHYYIGRILINGEYFYVCSQWFEFPANNDSRLHLLRLISSFPNSVQSSLSSDADVIAPPAESTGPKTVFVNINSRVAAPAEKANPEPVQAEQHDDSRTADLLFLEDAMQRIKECIARNGDVLSVKCARGYTPLMVAAQCDDADVLAVIIAKMKEANGNFEQRNDEGKTAYIVARESRAEKVMSLLKEAGARTDAAIIIARRKISAAEQNNCEKK